MTPGPGDRWAEAALFGAAAALCAAEAALMASDRRLITHAVHDALAGSWRSRALVWAGLGALVLHFGVEGELRRAALRRNCTPSGRQAVVCPA